MLLDDEALADSLIDTVKAYVAREIAPLRADNEALRVRIADLEAKASVPVQAPDIGAMVSAEVARQVAEIPAAKDGTSVTIEDVTPLVRHAVSDAMAQMRAAVDAAVKAAVAALPAPEDGKDADPTVIERMVADAVPRIPPARDGDDADPAVIERMVSEAVGRIQAPKGIEIADVAPMIESAVVKAVAALPVPKDGNSVTIDDVSPLVRQVVADEVARLPKAKDGVGLAGMLIDREGRLVATLSDGTMRALGQVVGRDGVDVDPNAVEKMVAAKVAEIPRPTNGQDGVGFDDLDLVETDAGLVLRFVRGERVKEFPLPVVIDRGVYSEGATYAKGSGVTWAGSFWIAQRATNAKPDSGDGSWRLAVKRGRDGKDGVVRPVPESAVVKVPAARSSPDAS